MQNIRNQRKRRLDGLFCSVDLNNPSNGDKILSFKNKETSLEFIVSMVHNTNLVFQWPLKNWFNYVCLPTQHKTGSSIFSNRNSGLHPLYKGCLSKKFDLLHNINKVVNCNFYKIKHILQVGFTGGVIISEIHANPSLLSLIPRIWNPNSNNISGIAPIFNFTLCLCNKYRSGIYNVFCQVLPYFMYWIKHGMITVSKLYDVAQSQQDIIGNNTVKTIIFRFIKPERHAQLRGITSMVYKNKSVSKFRLDKRNYGLGWWCLLVFRGFYFDSFFPPKPINFLSAQINILRSHTDWNNKSSFFQELRFQKTYSVLKTNDNSKESVTIWNMDRYYMRLSKLRYQYSYPPLGIHGLKFFL